MKKGPSFKGAVANDWNPRFQLHARNPSSSRLTRRPPRSRLTSVSER